MGTHTFAQTPLPVPDAIVEVLVQAGVEVVLGISGGNTNLIYRALATRTDEVRTVLVREEALATVMAEAYGRLTGRPAVAIGQSSWLLTNGGLGILEAHLGSSPMLVIGDLSDNAPYSHHAPYQAATGHPGGWDARGAFAALSKRTWTPQDAGEAVQATQLAVREALTGEPGPVVLLYHSRALRAEIDEDTRPRLYETAAYLHTLDAPDLTPEAAERIVGRLAGATAPLILAGNGVRLAQAQQSLWELASTLRIPVVTTASGKGTFPESDPLAYGTVGNFGSPLANERFRRADVILAVGTKLSPTDTAHESPGFVEPTEQHLIQIDAEPLNLGRAIPVAEGIVADAAQALRALVAAATAHRDADAEQRRSDEVARDRDASGWLRDPARDDTSTPLLPQRVIQRIQDSCAPGTVVTADAGENRIFMSHFFRTPDGVELLQPGGSGGMGYAIPAALGAKLARPDARCVAVCGDGGFGISMNGLLTALQESLPITVVIFNNAALGWVRHGQPVPIASEFPPIDYAAIARSMGCQADHVRSDDELAAALEKAAASEVPYVIDVEVSMEVTFRTVQSPLL